MKDQNKHLLLYDGDCGFCRRWITRWKENVGDKVEFQPYQTAGLLESFPETLLSECKKSVVLIDTESREKWTGAHAVFKVLAFDPRSNWYLKCYKYVPLFAPISEFFYRLVANHRLFFSKYS